MGAGVLPAQRHRTLSLNDLIDPRQFPPRRPVDGPRRAETGDHAFAGSPVFLVGDSAMGSPYFQSISLGFECAMFLAGLLAQRDIPVKDLLDRYELHAYRQWLRVHMRSKMIKHNKDLFECVGDTFTLLEKRHIY
jgi:2-polyprenyl-6-methoxyphenol hydroxylase-like FAD-dependent oxidoreductase